MSEHLTLLDKPECSVQATVWRDQLVDWLRADARPHSIALADRLSACTQEARCGSNACPICLGLWHWRRLREVVDILRIAPAILHVSLVPAGGKIIEGRLISFDMTRYASSRQEALRRALPNGTLAAGGFDLAFCESGEGRKGNWQVRSDLIVAADDTPDTRVTIEAARPGDASANEPFRFKAIEPGDILRVVATTMPNRACRGLQVDASDRPRDARLVTLRRDLVIEAALAHAQFPIGSGTIAIGI